MLKLEENTSKKRIIKVTKIVGIIFVIVFILEVWMVNRLSTYGNRIENLKQEEAALILQNQILENQIAQNQSLGRLEKLSNELGFDSIKNIEYYKSANIASAL